MPGSARAAVRRWTSGRRLRGGGGQGETGAGRGLLDRPRPVAGEQCPDVGDLASESGGPRLCVHVRLVGGRRRAVEHTERYGKFRRLEPDQQLCQRAVGLVVHQNVVAWHAFAYLNDLERERAGLQAEASLLMWSEEQRLAVLYVQLRVRRSVLRREAVEHAVVEDDAVLEHLDERRPAMRVRPLEQRHRLSLLRVHRARDEPAPGPQRERARRYGVLDRALGRGG